MILNFRLVVWLRGWKKTGGFTATKVRRKWKFSSPKKADLASDIASKTKDWTEKFPLD
jgi:hypothetical protein